MTIEQLPKGARKDTPDPRDYKFEEVVGAVIVDFTQEFRLPEPPDEDQDSSDDCVAEASSYYHWQLKGKRFSRRDLFCRIALNYGAEIRMGVKEIVDRGQATRDEVPDPEPQTPQNMRSSAGTKQEYREDDKELNYFVISGGGIDAVAAAIRDYQGVVFGVTGTNAGWQDLINPRPPSYGEPGQWGHALYGMGFHLHSGQKCIIAKSSWCNSAKEHHIKENYFVSGNTFNAWTLIPKGQGMFYQIEGELTLVQQVGDQYFEVATDPVFFPLLKEKFKLPDSFPTISRAVVNPKLGGQLVSGFYYKFN